MMLEVIATIFFSLLAMFQLALAYGAPLGEFAWGGSDKILPSKKRIGSAMSALVFTYLAIAAISVSEEYSYIDANSGLQTMLYVFGGFFAVNSFANWASKSPKEKYAMTPLAVIAASLCFRLAQAIVL